MGYLLVQEPVGKEEPVGKPIGVFLAGWAALDTVSTGSVANILNNSDLGKSDRFPIIVMSFVGFLLHDDASMHNMCD